MSNNKLIEITASELSKVDNNMLNEKQLSFILKPTPKDHVYTRKGRGGQNWSYVTGTYVKKVLNLVFGWDWSFEIVDHKIDINVGQAYVLGKLTVNSGGRSITKMQFGRVDIKFRKQTDEQAQKGIARQPLDVGNDLKAATTDALKKCASELGVASDVYAPNEFKQIKIVKEKTIDEKYDEISDLLEIEALMITETERLDYLHVLETKDVDSYDKALRILKSKLPNDGQ